MGLDFRFENRTDINNGPDMPHWTYSGFMRFREKLAEQIGINLKDMKGFGGEKSWDEVESLLDLLLNHSDCEGSIHYEFCEEIYPALLDAIKDWDNDGIFEETDYKQGMMLAECMKYAAENEFHLIFC